MSVQVIPPAQIQYLPCRLDFTKVNQLQTCSAVVFFLVSAATRWRIRVPDQPGGQLWQFSQRTYTFLETSATWTSRTASFLAATKTHNRGARISPAKDPFSFLHSFSPKRFVFCLFVFSLSLSPLTSPISFSYSFYISMPRIKT